MKQAHHRPNRRFVRTALLAIALTGSLAVADDDTLRDLGTNAAPGEIPKWDGSQWRAAHDDITTVVAGGPGVVVTGTNKSVTISLDFGAPKTNATVATYQEMDTTRPPIGAIVAWAKTLTGVSTNLPSGWIECNGQPLSDTNSPLNGTVIPNLNGTSGTKRFLRGSTTSGATGGSESTELDSGDLVRDTTSANNYAIVKEGGNLKILTAFGTDDAYYRAKYTISDIKPPYYEVVWIMRIK